MIKIGILGLGNAGGQVAALAASEAGFDAVALNTSVKDLKTIEEFIPALVAGDEKGAGKDRATAKAFMRDSIHKILATEEIKLLLDDKDVVFLISSTGGGSGSGMTPVMQNILQRSYPHIRFNVIHILPMLEESLAEQQNTTEYLAEMLKTDPTYLSYDNNSKHGAETKTDVMNKINRTIVQHLKIMRMDYQTLTPYASMDEKDMMRLLQTPGRLVIGHTEGFKEKDVDTKDISSRLVDSIKTTGATELESDRSVLRTGIIYNLEEKLYKGFDIAPLTDFIGTPVEGFEHIALGDDVNNSVSVIAAGLSFPDDRVEKIAQRIEELKQAVTQSKGSRVLGSIETDELKELRRQDNQAVESVSKQEIDDLFGEY